MYAMGGGASGKCLADSVYALTETILLRAKTQKVFEFLREKLFELPSGL
jgi:hypothetical protein